MLNTGDLITLVAEKPAAGGPMLARYEGQVVLVGGTIPGETVRARVERVAKGVAHATMVEVIEAHADRRPVAGDVACGGAVYAHIAYDTQLRLKGDVIRDGLARLGHLSWDAPLRVEASPERGYRMRARLHVRDGRVGFLREGTHELCDAGQTGQLLPSTNEALSALSAALGEARQQGAASIELSENIAGDERAAHIELAEHARLPSPKLLRGLHAFTGLTWTRTEDRDVRLVHGEPFVTDRIPVPAAPPADGELRLDPAGGRAAASATIAVLRRHVRAFFQGNRFLLPTLVREVLSACPDGPVVDLYAGAGLFSVCLAATGRHQVVAVEGHATTAEDLRVNAAPYADRLFVRHLPVERFLAGARGTLEKTLILDPPRTGMTKEACDGAIGLGAERVVFVSCDVATLARDIGRFTARGYRLTSLRGFDLFPNTAHVEVLAVLDRA
jgi:tRNA/tmRNA/rRNA uracil-C5-methylase (TrmA/RlmC/RlmD family)